MCGDQTITTLPLTTTSKNLFYPHKLRLYPQFSTGYPHLGVKRVKTDITAISALLGLLLNTGGELVDLVIDRAALRHQLTDFAVGVHHCCVIAAAECLADFR